jgi:hypothetical protein
MPKRRDCDYLIVLNEECVWVDRVKEEVIL